MSDDERQVLRAAVEMSTDGPYLIEYTELAARTKLDVSRVRAAAAAMQRQRLCIATFGGLQLTAAGLSAATQA